MQEISMTAHDLYRVVHVTDVLAKILSAKKSSGLGETYSESCSESIVSY